MKTKETNFPTIKEIAEALKQMQLCYEVTYNEKTRMFNCTQIVEFPHYDDGGGIDSIDVEEFNTDIPFFDAYKAFEDYQNFMHNPYSEVAYSVEPYENTDFDDDYLPF